MAGLAWIAGVGSSRGLGAATARRFARGGLSVVITGRTAERLETIAKELRGRGATIHVAIGDVSDPAHVERLAAHVAEIGELRAAVFNAGNATRLPSLELPPQQFEEAWRTSAFGGFLFGQAAVRAMQHTPVSLDSRKSGILIFTGATGSLRGKPPFIAFAAAKAALRSVAQTFAREFGPSGIHVAHVVIDGGIDGDRLRNSAPQRAEASGADGLLNPEAIAETYWQLYLQHRSAWTHELDLRPYKELF